MRAWADAVRAAARAAGVADADARRVLEAWAEVVLAEAAAGRHVRFPGFGTFDRGTRRARRIRDPLTREIVWLPETATLRFRAAAPARRRLR